MEERRLHDLTHCPARPWCKHCVCGAARTVLTTDDAQQLVELQADENGPEAWRQLSIRFDPIGKSYAFDQMASLMEVPRCKQLTDRPPR